jgi:RNA polymerase sigma-70 factor, ECF subfamily
MEKEKAWKEHSKGIKAFVMSKVKDRDLCNDIMQDVYIRMHQNFDRVKDESKIKPWLFTIARNVVNDNYRNQKQFKTDNIENGLVENGANKKFEKCLVPHINKLPAIYKEAFTKVELANYSQLQLAEELKISYSGAKSRVQRAKQLLKQYFSKCCNIRSDKYGNIVSYSEEHSCKAC